LRGQGGATQQTALEFEDAAQGAGGVAERLGRERRVAADEGERGRADEHRLERLRAGAIGCPLGQRILDDAEARVRVAKLGAQLRRLGDGQAAIVDSEDRLRRLDLTGDLLHDGCLLISVHLGLWFLS
jgi:hypothetical protein